MENVSLFQVVSAALALILLIDISVLWLTGKQVPALLGELVMGVFISYFASGFGRSRELRPRKPPQDDGARQPESQSQPESHPA